MARDEESSESDRSAQPRKKGKKGRDEIDPSLILKGSEARRHAKPSEKQGSAGNVPFRFLKLILTIATEQAGVEKENALLKKQLKALQKKASSTGK